MSKLTEYYDGFELVESGDRDDFSNIWVTTYTFYIEVMRIRKCLIGTKLEAENQIYSFNVHLSCR